MVATGGNKKEDAIQQAALLTLIGEEGRRIYNNFTVPEDAKFDNLMGLFENHFIGKSNKTYERHVFRQIRQGEKNFDMFLQELRTQATKCDFRDKADENICDQIIEGIASVQLKEKLLTNEEATIEKFANTCKAYENVTRQLKEMEVESKSEVHANFKRRSSKQRHQNKSKQWGETKMANDKSDQREKGERPRINNCTRCGRSHDINKCPAYNKRCLNCNKLGHFQKMCRLRHGSSVNYAEQFSSNDRPYMYGPAEPTNPSTSGDDQGHFIGHIASVGAIESTRWYIHPRVGSMKKEVKFKLDTGSDVSILPLRTYRAITNKPLSQPTKQLTAYNNAAIKIAGEIKLPVYLGDRSGVINFAVVDQDSIPLFGLYECLNFNLVQRVDEIKVEPNSMTELFKQYEDTFEEELGGLNEKPVKLVMKDDAQPVQNAPRRIPFAQHDRVKAELDRMEGQGIISKVDGPTDWISSMVVVEKLSGDLRICLDPRNLNQYLKSDQFKIPTVEEMTVRIAGSKHFVKLDARSSFWQMKLDDESSQLTTFSTPFGNYCFHRLPFGLNVSSQIYQRTLSNWFQAKRGVEVYIDDILIHADDEETLMRRVEEVFEIIRTKNLKLNRQKCTTKLTEIKYLGVIISAEGQKIDPERIASIQAIESPKSKEELQRFLGMITYVGKFIPNLSEETALLRQLLKEKIAFVWTENHEVSFNRLKSLLASAPVLKLFDPAEKVTISCDASRYGIGVALLQCGQPVAFASRTLTSAEQQYAQIEKELLSVAYASEKFHQYVYGRHYVIENDHKPLKFILNKPLANAPARIERLMLRLQRYDFSYEWVPGKLLFIADTLSRAPATLKEEDRELENEIKCHVHLIKATLPFSDDILRKFRRENEEDMEIQHLAEMIKIGWPDEYKDVSDELKQYWNFREELSHEDGLIFKGTKVLIPKAWQSEMIDRVHEGHLGVEKCYDRARSAMFWCGMCKEIKDVISRCETCQKFAPQQQKQPLQSHERPNVPWLKIGCDVFHFDGKDYLLAVDYYSNYFETAQLSTLSTEHTIQAHKSMFSRNGIPETVVSDNGTNFVSAKFVEFSKKWGITHVTSSPYYPKSNGLAERYVGIVKTLLKKSKDSNTDPYLALLNYRDTAVMDGKSPAQLLNGRKLRTRLPTTQAELKPRKQSDINQARKNSLQNQARFYDRSATPLRKLQPSEPVVIWCDNKKIWNPAIVTSESAQQPRSYNLQTPEGAQYRRNRQHIRPVQQPVQLPSTGFSPGKTIPEDRCCPQFSSPTDNTVTNSPNDGTVTRSGREIKLPARYR